MHARPRTTYADRKRPHSCVNQRNYRSLSLGVVPRGRDDGDRGEAFRRSRIRSCVSRAYVYYSAIIPRRCNESQERRRRRRAYKDDAGEREGGGLWKC